MRDLDRWKDKVELQLDGRQIFFLFFGSAICACLIFALGVVVGKRVEARHNAQVQTQAEDPLQALDELGNAEEGLTFHSALSDPSRDRKGAAEARAQEAKAAETKAAAKAAEVKVAEAKAQEPRPAAAKAAEARPAEAREAAKEQQKEAKAASPAAKTHFTLQLSAFATKTEAADFMRRLREAGYKPYVTETMIPGKGLMYRVRLGDYPSRDSALAAKSEFERKQKIVAYVAKL
jgi:cell division septation protein DedD